MILAWASPFKLIYIVFRVNDLKELKNIDE